MPTAVSTAPEMEQTQREVITLNGVNYFVDSLSEEAGSLVKDVQTVEGELQRQQLQVNITNIAKGALIGKLEVMAEGFEKVPEPVAEEAPSE